MDLNCQTRLATLERAWWFNDHRLMEAPGYLHPAEYEKQFRVSQAAPVAPES